MTRPAGPSKHSQWHHDQRRRVLNAHPEMRRLFGAEPLQVLAVLALTTARWALVFALRESPVWKIGLLACTMGCWTVHGLGTYAHEQAHRLVASAEPWATVVDVIIEVGMTSFGKAVGYQYRHVNFHHVYLGDYEWDPEMRDLCAHVSILSTEHHAWLVARGLVLLEGCLAVLLPGGGLFSQDIVEALRAKLLPGVEVHDKLRSPRFSLPPRLQRKQDAFAILSIVCYAVVMWFWGWRASLFALWSLAVKASRFDVIGWGQDMAEHNSHDDSKPTNSTLTFWNWIFANTGYHTEHHSFPQVPGCYLPQLTRAAPDEFEQRGASPLWPLLW
eukprot:CAMPEP_0183357496 /NCGR_PEP_ID=MMETSP0164_2-20130417/46459_1 /TAXON_ID=221442 /ORGANISM="Coccolithus pelagicus ssp braarudi, Strain PLY182g" /LENGTH=329 /DNA_ID=CAMNT_0025531123 /DNA_START=35 /DNA_END=1021 /DNA_ORIENTATION=-